MSALADTAAPAAACARRLVHSTQTQDRGGAAVGSLRGRCVIFLHAHPDDEAIFTAVTMHRLACVGARVVLVTATGGELGPVLRPLRSGETLAGRRRAELEQACTALGVARLVLLGRRDSGMLGWADNGHPDALARADVAALARRLAELCLAEGADALVHYDANGIYGHPDHVAVHRIGARAAALVGMPGYQTTVDRDHLSGRGRHLVEKAATGGGPGASATVAAGRSTVPAAASPAGASARSAGATASVGRPGADVTTVVVADSAGLTAKRAAMAAHRSQIDPVTLRRRGFADAYGQEWYVRTGDVGVLDRLSTSLACPP